MNRLLFVPVLLLSLCTGAVPAQMLSIPVGQQAPELQGISVPKRGMSQAEVEAQFGAPQARGEAIGQPPISRWEYADYDVYFEQDRVLHTVLRHKQ